MNRTDFNQTGGFPLETETLERMQTAYDIFQAFGELVGTKSIVKGCIQTSNNISNGVIYWDGELLPFIGGGLQDKIIIVEAVTDAEFEDGETRTIHYDRHATFGTGTDAVLWTEFKRAYPLTSALYLDKVDMYAGDLAKIPAGWHLCDGSNGTVDLRARFVVGMDPNNTDYDAIGKTGGAEEVALNINQMPTHNHTGTTSSAGSHSHLMRFNQQSDDSGSGGSANDMTVAGSAYNKYTDSAGNHSHSLNINNKGSNQAHENRPPFYTMAFIQFKGL